MKLGASRSPKLAGLARDLGISKREAIGLLELLWEWTWEQAPLGDVGRWADADIAEAVGEPPARADALIAALVKRRWLDYDSEHRLVVHGYAEHLMPFMRKRLKRQGLDPLAGGDGVAADAKREPGGVHLASTRPTVQSSSAESSSVQFGGVEPSARGARSPADAGRRKRKTLDPAGEELVTWAIEHYAETTGIRCGAEAEGHRKPLRALLLRREDGTDPDAFRDAWRAVVLDRWERIADWDPERMRRFCALETLCRPSRWPGYLAEARTPKPARGPLRGQQRGGKNAPPTFETVDYGEDVL